MEGRGGHRMYTHARTRRRMRRIATHARLLLRVVELLEIFKIYVLEINLNCVYIRFVYDFIDTYVRRRLIVRLIDDGCPRAHTCMVHGRSNAKLS